MPMCTYNGPLKAVKVERRPPPQRGPGVLTGGPGLALDPKPAPLPALPEAGPAICGPFKVLRRLNEVCHRLQIPPDYYIIPLFHVSPQAGGGRSTPGV
jgi:hypothetical protein